MTTFVKQAIASFRIWYVSVTYSQFLDACDTGDLTVVEQGLASPELRVIVSNNIDSLVMAAKNGHLAVVNRLLEIDSVRMLRLVEIMRYNWLQNSANFLWQTDC